MPPPFEFVAGVQEFAEGAAPNVSGLQTPDPHTLVVHLRTVLRRSRLGGRYRLGAHSGVGRSGPRRRSGPVSGRRRARTCTTCRPRPALFGRDTRPKPSVVNGDGSASAGIRRSHRATTGYGESGRRVGTSRPRGTRLHNRAAGRRSSDSLPLRPGHHRARAQLGERVPLPAADEPCHPPLRRPRSPTLRDLRSGSCRRARRDHRRTQR